VVFKNTITHCEIGSFMDMIEKNSVGFMGTNSLIHFDDLSTVLRKTEKLQKWEMLIGSSF